MTAADVATIALLVGSCGAAVVALLMGGLWIKRRIDERGAADSFIDNHLPENGDVARDQADRDACVALAEVVGELQELGLVR